jgi:hypothetical protein
MRADRGAAYGAGFDYGNDISWFAEDNMVAGDSKRIVVIKNISSNLIEEAILILKPGQDAPEVSGGKPAQNGPNKRNDLLLKEAEFIINQYIREHGLIKSRNKHLPPRKIFSFNISVNAVINFFLAVAVVFLLFVIGKYIF